MFNLLEKLILVFDETRTLLRLTEKEPIHKLLELEAEFQYLSMIGLLTTVGLTMCCFEKSLDKLSINDIRA